MKMIDSDTYHHMMGVVNAARALRQISQAQKAEFKAALSTLDERVDTLDREEEGVGHGPESRNRSASHGSNRL